MPEIKTKRRAGELAEQKLHAGGVGGGAAPRRAAGGGGMYTGTSRASAAPALRRGGGGGVAWLFPPGAAGRGDAALVTAAERRLVEAAAAGDAAALAAEARRGVADVARAATAQGVPILALAAAKGNLGIVRMLLSGRIDQEVASTLPGALLAESGSDEAEGGRGRAGSDTTETSTEGEAESDGGEHASEHAPPARGNAAEGQAGRAEAGRGKRAEELDCPGHDSRANCAAAGADPRQGGGNEAKRADGVRGAPSVRVAVPATASPAPPASPAVRSPTRVPDVTAEEERQVIAIQAACRGRLARRRAEELRKAQASAVLNASTGSARAEPEPEPEPLPKYLMLPNEDRGLLLTQEEERQVTKIQSAVRRRQAQREVAQRRAQKLAREEEATARAAQRFARVPDVTETDEQCIVKAQAAVRGYLVRKQTAELRAENRTPETSEPQQADGDAERAAAAHALSAALKQASPARRQESREERRLRRREDVIARRATTAKRVAARAAAREAAAARMATRLLSARAPSGATPLCIAAGAGQLEAVKILLAAGADVGARMEIGATAAFMALANGHAEVAARLFEAEKAARNDGVQRTCTKGGEMIVHAAAKSGSAECLRLALESGGGDARTPDAKGNLPIHHAARARDAGALKALLADAEGGAQPDVQVLRRLTTPLMIAAAAGATACTTVLLEAGAQLHACDSRGRTALHHAAASGKCECLRLLLAARAHVEARDSRGRTPLMHAAMAGCLPAIDVLLSPSEGGAEVGVEDDDGMHAIHLAAREGKARASAALANAGGCLLARDAKYRLSAREWAERGAHWKVAELLKLAARARWLHMRT